MQQLTKLTNILQDVETLLRLFDEARAQIPDDEWNKLCDDPLIGPLFDSISDLEYTADS